ncbi:MAG TPA: lantibiotic dehydratase, partial [Herpetosiphonaceae bacterium]
RITDSLQRVLRERWHALLAPQYDERRLTYSCEQLRSQVLAAFDAPHPGWQSARYHSPDLMIAAADAEAIRRNDYQLVLGEFHMAMNTAKINLFLSQHPAPQAISQALEHDLPHPVIIPVVSKQWPAPPPRTLASLAAAKDFRLLFAHDSCGIAPEQGLPIGSLVIEETEQGLVVSTHDRRLRFDIVEVFGELLTFRVTDCLKLLEQRKHTPRISFDRLIVCRESWHFSPSEIAFVHESAEVERFIAARRWLNLHGIPRFVFMKSSVEEKPVYVDFDSPLLLDLFAKIVRRTAAQGGPEASVRITEMLPDPNHIWLPDHADQRYTSELRTVAVDPLLTPRRAL